jgi:hypothetical protein
MSDLNSTPQRDAFPWKSLLSLSALAGLYFGLLRPQLLRHGLRPDEAKRSLPGDDIILHPDVVMTYAITVQAPPKVLWAWLAQMGRQTVGFYSFDVFTNHGLASAISLRDDLPPLVVGEKLDNGLQVLALSAPESLVLGDFRRPHFLNGEFDLTQAYQLESSSENSTRLFYRLRLYSFGLRGLLHNLLTEPLCAAYLRNHLANLKVRAETSKYQFAFGKQHANGHVSIKLEHE